MEPFSDPAVDALMEKYFDADEIPQYLYPGSQADITKKLRDWVHRHIDGNKRVMVAREKCHANTNARFEWHRNPGSSPRPPTVAEVVKHTDYIHDLDENTNQESMRANYLLNTLRHRGITWPELWYLPEADGGVCSYLGTIDPTFDVRGTLLVFEDKEHEECFVATLAELKARVGLDSSGNTPPSKPTTESADNNQKSDGQESGNPKNKARAQQRKKARAKAREEASAARPSDSGHDSINPSADIMAQNLVRAEQALSKNSYPGIVFYKGKVAAMGENMLDARARLERFIETEFGVGSKAEEVLGESVLCPIRSDAKNEEHGSKAKAESDY